MNIEILISQQLFKTKVIDMDWIIYPERHRCYKIKKPCKHIEVHSNGPTYFSVTLVRLIVI